MRSTTTIYHPFIRCHASLCRGGCAPRNRSISLPFFSVCRQLSSLRLAFIAWTSLQMWAWYLAGSWRAETLSLTSLHVSLKINAFFLSSQALGFGMDLHRAAKSLSSLVGVVRGRRKSCVRLPRYPVCYLRGALLRHPRVK